MPASTDRSSALLKRVDAACKTISASEKKTYLEGIFNWQRRDLFAKKGLLGIPLEKKYGGAGADLLTYVKCLERIAMEGSSLRTFFSVHTSLGQLIIQQYGTAAQKRRYLPKTVTGELLMGFGLTEPDAGSDPKRMKTAFVEKKDHFVLNGKKKWIGNATVGGLFTVYAKDQKGRISAFIVESAFEGFSSRPIKNLIGMRNHDVGYLILKDCKVPKANLLGKKGQGLHIAYDNLLNGRLSVCAGCVGVMQDCLNESVAYAKKRRQHGKPIAKHQLVQEHIAKIAVDLEAARHLVLAAAKAKEQYLKTGKSADRDYADTLIAKAKYFITPASFDAASRAVQIFGGEGYHLENKVARHFCDERVLQIYEGTEEILALKIAYAILGKGYSAF